MTWPLMWLNKSVITINDMLQLIYIYIYIFDRKLRTLFRKIKRVHHVKELAQKARILFHPYKKITYAYNIFS